MPVKIDAARKALKFMIAFDVTWGTLLDLIFYFVFHLLYICPKNASPIAA